MIHPRLAPSAAFALTVVLTLGLAACSAQDELAGKPAFSVPGNTIGKAAKGDECNDPSGDLSDDPKGAGTLTQPAGIDLVHAEAKVNDELLVVTFETAAPIESAANPAFFLQQGDTAQALSVTFEIRAETDPSGQWKLRLITFNSNRERSTPLEVPINVAGTKLSYSVPTKSLPTVATILWQFGSTGGVSDNNRVIDDCLPFAQASSTPATSAAGASTVVQVPTRTGAVAQPITATDGSKITILAVDNPAKPTRELKAKPIPQDQVAAVQAEVCAGTGGLDRVGDFRFTIQASDGRSFDPWAADDFTNEPRFKLETSLRSGECERGWIDYEIPKDSQITQVTYDVGGKKVGPYVVVKTG